METTYFRLNYRQQSTLRLSFSEIIEFTDWAQLLFHYIYRLRKLVL